MKISKRFFLEYFQGFMNYVTRKNGIKVVFTDVGGAKASRRSWKQFYASTDILVFKYKLNLLDEIRNMI